MVYILTNNPWYLYHKCFVFSLHIDDFYIYCACAETSVGTFFTLKKCKRYNVTSERLEHVFKLSYLVTEVLPVDTVEEGLLEALSEGGQVWQLVTAGDVEERVEEELPQLPTHPVAATRQRND